MIFATGWRCRPGSGRWYSKRCGPWRRVWKNEVAANRFHLFPEREAP